MNCMEERDKNLARYRFEKAKQCILSAEYIMQINDYNLVSNRSYYAIFHGMRAVLALERKDFEKHSGVIGYFRKEYIKTHIIPVEASAIIGNAFDARNESDYKDWYNVDKEEAEMQLQSSAKFLKMIEKYLVDKNVL